MGDIRQEYSPDRRSTTNMDIGIWLIAIVILGAAMLLRPKGEDTKKAVNDSAQVEDREKTEKR